MRNSKGFVIFCLIFSLFFMWGCSYEDNDDGSRLKVVATIFPAYDWCREIAGDNCDITLLMDNGTDMHSFQPTVADIVKVSEADIFIYVGGESDTWVTDALSQAVNEDMKVISLLDVLGDRAKAEELVEGMKTSEKESDEEEEEEYDEHVWLSLRNAEIFCDEITKVLCEADSVNSENYTANNEAYQLELEALDDKYRSATESASYHTVMFGDRFPFRYLFDDYSIDYYAAYLGCEAETEASFETVSFLTEKIDELDLPGIMVIDGGSDRLSKVILENSKNADRRIERLDSMQSVTGTQAANGVTYIGVMKDNLNALESVMN